MSDHCLIAVYGTVEDARSAIEVLQARDVPMQRVSLIAQSLHSDELHGYITVGDAEKTGAETGAWMGGIFGLLGGAAFLWVPGFGPLVVAGSVAASLVGMIPLGLSGVLTGGLIGAMVGRGTSSQRMKHYDELLKSGRLLVAAEGNHEELTDASNALPKQGLIEVSVHPIKEALVEEDR